VHTKSDGETLPDQGKAESEKRSASEVSGRSFTEVRKKIVPRKKESFYNRNKTKKERVVKKERRKRTDGIDLETVIAITATHRRRFKSRRQTSRSWPMQPSGDHSHRIPDSSVRIREKA